MPRTETPPATWTAPDGWIELPEGPGLGLMLDDDRMGRVDSARQEGEVRYVASTT